MIDERATELMNGAIDGVLSREETAELRRRLDADPEARVYYEELREVHLALGAGGETAPPASLRESIVSKARDIDRGRPGGKRRRPSRFRLRRTRPAKPTGPLPA